MQTEKRQCPRCGDIKTFYVDPAMNATSRLDTKTSICAGCALDESLGQATDTYKWKVPIATPSEITRCVECGESTEFCGTLNNLNQCSECSMICSKCEKSVGVVGDLSQEGECGSCLTK